MSAGANKFPILFLGGAKRVSVGRMLEKAFADRGYEARFFSYEIDPRVPVACMARVVQGLRWSDPAIYDDLARVVDEFGIRMIVPFVDGAVDVAATFVERNPAAGVFLPGADAARARTMFDKVEAARVFEELGLPVPPTWRPGEPACFPLIAKPRRGSASKGISVIDGPEALGALEGRMDDYIVQRYIADREEISVDCYVSVRSGEVLAVSPRRRIETLGGEAVRSITVDSPRAEALVRRTLEATGLRGAVTVQLICDRAADELMIMEINPRLGGGVVCSIGAGADIPGVIADEALGLTPSPSAAVPGTEMCRYFQEVIFKP